MALDIKPIFNRTTKNVEFLDSTDYTNAGDFPLLDASLPVKWGVKMFFDGNMLYQNDDFISPPLQVDFTGSNPATPVLSSLSDVPMITNYLDEVIDGEYEFVITEQYTDTNVALQVVSAPQIKFNYVAAVLVAEELTNTIDLLTPSINVTDATDYDIGVITPTITSPTMTMTYPSTSAQTPLNTTTNPLVINTTNVWTKEYSVDYSLVAQYDFTDYFEKYIYGIDDYTFSVNSSDLCDVLPCIIALKAQIDALSCTSNTEYINLQAKYEKVMALAENVDIMVGCNNNDGIPALIQEIRDLLDCTNEEDSQEVLPTGSGGGSALEVNNGIISDTAVDEIVIGTGLTLTNPTSGTVNVVAEVTQAELDLLELAVLTNETNIGVNASDIAAIPNVQVSTLAISELSFNALDTVPIVISSGLAGKSIVYLGATIVSGGGTNGLTTCDLLISKDPTSGDSGQANAIATARLDSSEVAITAVGGGTSFSVAGGKALMDIGEELYITAVTSAVYDWVGTWNLSVSYIIL